MTYSLKVSIVGFILAVLCAASVARAEEGKLTCTHIGNLTVCTRN